MSTTHASDASPSNILAFHAASRTAFLPPEQAGQIVPFVIRKASRIGGRTVAPARRRKRAPKTPAPPERISKAECHAMMRERIEAVGKVLNLSPAEIKPAMSLKHEQVGIFAKKCGLKLDWLIAGEGCAFRSRGELFELAVQFEQLLKIERSLKAESSRLWDLSDRVRYEKMGIDPDDSEACKAAHQTRHREWMNWRDIADRETGYDEAWRKMNDANKRKNKVARRIFEFMPPTESLGILIRLRMLETAEEAFRGDQVELMMAEIRAFFARRRPAWRSM